MAHGGFIEVHLQSVEEGLVFLVCDRAYSVSAVLADH